MLFSPTVILSERSEPKDLTDNGEKRFFVAGAPLNDRGALPMGNRNASPG